MHTPGPKIMLTEAKRAARANRKLRSMQPDHPLRALTTPQLQALQQWVNHYRNNWKQELSAAWLRAGARAAYYTPELQQIRNLGGDALLQKITFADIEVLLTERRSKGRSMGNHNGGGA